MTKPPRRKGPGGRKRGSGPGSGGGAAGRGARGPGGGAKSAGADRGGESGVKGFGMSKVGQKKRALEKRRSAKLADEEAPLRPARRKRRRPTDGDAGAGRSASPTSERGAAAPSRSDRDSGPRGTRADHPGGRVRKRSEVAPRPAHASRPARRPARGSRSDRLRLVATCGLGLEPLLAEELSALGVPRIEPEQGAVRFEGTWRDCWRANRSLRTANRVLVEIGGFRVESDDELYDGARRLFDRDPELAGTGFSEIAHPKRSLSVRASSRASRVGDVRWIALKVKDALVDAQRDREGRRGDVARRGADVPLRVFLRRNHATVLLDTSGRPLDHRGYREETTVAPVREQLAAACVLAAGYEGPGPIYDPMCGSGTLLIEASWALEGAQPGRLRYKWVFERWPSFDRARYRELLDEDPPFEPKIPLIGADSSADAVAAAQTNVRAAGVDRVASFEVADGLEGAPPAPEGLLLVNPAYGHRLESVPDFWPRLGDTLKQRYRGWRAVVLAGDEHRGKHIGLRAKRRLSVWNGSIQARILVFDLY